MGGVGGQARHGLPLLVSRCVALGVQVPWTLRARAGAQLSAGRPPGRRGLPGTDRPVPGGGLRGRPQRRGRLDPSSRFGLPGTFLGAQEILAIVNPYGEYFLGPGDIPGGPNRAHRFRSSRQPRARWGTRTRTATCSSAAPARSATRSPTSSSRGWTGLGRIVVLSCGSSTLYQFH